MRTRSTLRWTALALLVLLPFVAGCGSSSRNPLGPGTSDLTQSEANDIALQTAFVMDYVGFDVEAAGSSMSSSSRMPTLADRLMPLGARWDTTVTVGGLTVAVSRRFYDAEGTELADFGPDVARMNWRSDIRGTVETPRDTATVAHHSNYDFTGLQEADSQAVVNGACADTLLNTFRSLDGEFARHAWWRSALTVANVGVRKSDGHPVSGTLTLTVRVDVLNSSDQGDVAKRLVAVVVITFNGTSQPDVVVNGRYHYKWIMDEGTMVPV